MPLSHTCPACGMELCRLRAAPDPVYALPVVVCPRCAAASVRRRHPQSRAWAVVFRGGAAWSRVILHMLLLVAFTLVFNAFLHSLRVDLTTSWPAIREAVRDPEGVPLRRVLLDSGLLVSLIGWLCYASALDAWLIAGFGHWRRWTVVPAWVGAMFAIGVGSIVLDAGAHALDAWIQRTRLGLDDVEVGRYVQTFVLAPASLVVGTPGALIGLAIRVAARGSAGRGLRRRLRRTRRRRTR